MAREAKRLPRKSPRKSPRKKSARVLRKQRGGNLVGEVEVTKKEPRSPGQPLDTGVTMTLSIEKESETYIVKVTHNQQSFNVDVKSLIEHAMKGTAMPVMFAGKPYMLSVRTIVLRSNIPGALEPGVRAWGNPLFE